MRPKSIQNFARLMVLSILIGLVNTALTWDDSMAEAASAGLGSGFVIGVQLGTLAVILLLLWFIVQKGSNVARWIYTVLCALGLIMSVPALLQAGGQDPLQVIMLVTQSAITILSVWLLFRPDSNAWFSGRGRRTDPEVFS
jgi:hypothetical protein